MRKLILTFLFFFWGCSSYERIPYSQGDFFAFESLHIYGRDYEIEKIDIGVPCSAFAIHGGLLERETDRLAKSFADRGTNYYAFKIISKKA